MLQAAFALAIFLPCPAASVQEDARARDLAEARALFERNIAAILERDREGYLACYLESERLVRTGPTGPSLGWEELASGTAPSGGDEWPDELVARDLRLTWLEEGWVYGSYRYRVSYGGAIEEGISERVFRRTAQGWRIVVTTAFGAPGGVPAPPLALVGATIYDGGDGEAIEDGVVVVRDGRIETVGPAATTPVPDGVETVDLSGRFVVPGLIDTHVHYSQTGWADGRPDAFDLRASHPYEEVQAELERSPERFHRAFLASGVTAVFDNGGYPWTRRMGPETELSTLAPHVVAAGPLLTTFVPEELTLPDRAQFVLIEDDASARRAVRSHAASGSDAIKVWFIVRAPGDRERLAGAVHAAGEEADAVGLPLIVHATQLETARVALEAGATLLVHSVDDAPVDEAFLALALERGTFYCPTLVVTEGYEVMYRGEIPPEIEAELEWVAPEIRARILSTPSIPKVPGMTDENVESISTLFRMGRERMEKNLVAVHAAGIPVVVGTDAGNPFTVHGPSIFREMEAMQAAGLSPRAVLTAATRDAARAIGRGGDLGLLAAGRIADLVVLERDPGQDVANLRSLTHVMRAGALSSRAILRPR